MALSDSERAFLDQHRQAAMITVGSDGRPRVARVGVALVDGKLWSSGTQTRVRTKRLRRDPRCTLFVFDTGFSWLGLDTTVRILEGPDAAELSVRLFRLMQNRPTGNLSWFGGELSPEDFRRTMAEEQRLIYEFDITRSYGMTRAPPGTTGGTKEAAMTEDAEPRARHQAWLNSAETPHR
jgi:PPOX class probable F420-dependent enzyme